MHMRSLLLAGAGALALGLVATSAQAAPTGVNLPAVVAEDASDAGLVQKVHRYRDWDYYYYRPYYRHRYYRDYDYYYYRPRYYYNPYYYNYRYRHRNW